MIRFERKSGTHAAFQVNMTESATMDRRKWLLRLIYVRVVIFTLFVAGEVTKGPQGHSLIDLRNLLFAAYALSIFWFLVLRASKSYVWQSYGQIAMDLALITWTINRTGGVDSYFLPIYFLEIVMSSILLERRGAFLAATASSLIHFAHMDLSYFGVIPSTTNAWPELVSLQYIISLSIFGFCSVAFLSNFLAESWRNTGDALERSTGQVAFLRAFSGRLITSMGTGLVTTDLDGKIYMFNPAAEEVSGYSADEALRMKISDVFPGIMPDVAASRFEVSTTRKTAADH